MHSITHFDGFDFSSNSFPTLINKVSHQTISAQRNWLSKIDQAKINEIYCRKSILKTTQKLCVSCSGKLNYFAFWLS